MNDFLQNIIVDEGYFRMENSPVELFGNSNEFFILEYFKKEDFEFFFESEQLDCLISKFQSLKDSKIKKNTSLFILIKVDNLKEFYNQYLSTIMTIEEDAYYFRKYVIFYTEGGLKKLNCSSKALVNYVHSEIEDDDSLFGKFENNMFFEDAYFIAMQLIIKLPFISLPHANEHFEMIEDRIESRIKDEHLIESEQKLNQILEMLNVAEIKEQLESGEILKNLNQILGD